MKNKINKKTKIFIIAIVILILILVILLVPMKLPIKILKFMYPQKYDNFVTLYAKEYHVDANLVYAIMKAESNFDPNAISGKSAKGLMQLVDDTAIDIAKRLNLHINIEELPERIQAVDLNIQLGTKYISMLLERYNYNISVALTAYNAGIGTVDNWIEKGTIKADGSDIENIPYKETNQYVRKILRDYKIYQNLY